MKSNKYHVVSVVSNITGIKNTIFTNLEKANEYYYERLELAEKPCKYSNGKTVVYLEEDTNLVQSEEEN